ncbi:MAG: hypothetical protein L7F77_06490 [Candidatus Magnetominusculus sp. LBB02]|nr:hypothetical protein [Candidatus Magnetominusculus sp. LBB02]
MKLKTKDNAVEGGTAIDSGRYNEVDLDRLIKWTLLFALVYFGASLLLK